MLLKLYTKPGSKVIIQTRMKVNPHRDIHNQLQAPLGVTNWSLRTAWTWVTRILDIRMKFSTLGSQFVAQIELR